MLNINPYFSCLASHKRDISKQCRRHRTLFVLSSGVSLKRSHNKNQADTLLLETERSKKLC